MLLKPQFLSVPEQAARPARQHRPVQYMYHSSHSMLQFLPQKLAEWIANNYAVELNVPPRLDPSKPWSTATLNRILQTCIVSDSRGINIHTFQTVEFESDLYRGVMRARCYPFNMRQHQFRGRNIKVSTYTLYMSCIYYVYTNYILCIYMYKADPAHFRIVWERSLHIHSTLECVTTIMTLPTHCLIQTACGLCVPNCSSTVRCVP
jgi:hypothetical protein